MLKIICILLLVSSAIYAYGPTTPTDNLYRIALHLKPPTATVDQTMLALLQANPQAFAYNNINTLKTGMVLSLPDTQLLEQYSAVQATQLVAEQDAWWRQHRLDQEFLHYNSLITGILVLVAWYLLKLWRQHRALPAQPDAYDFLSGEDPLLAKLNLARVYVAMGNNELAQELLQDILAQGNPEHKLAAQELLQKLCVSL